MSALSDFRAAAEEIVGDPTGAVDVTDPNALTEALDAQAPGWREIPNEILQSELAAIRRYWLNEADRLLDAHNEAKDA